MNGVDIADQLFVHTENQKVVAKARILAPRGNNSEQLSRIQADQPVIKSNSPCILEVGGGHLQKCTSPVPVLHNPLLVVPERDHHLQLIQSA